MVKSIAQSTTSIERAEFLQALTLALECSTAEAPTVCLFDAMQAFGPELAGAAASGGDALSLLLDVTDSIDEAILFETVAHERRKAC